MNLKLLMEIYETDSATKTTEITVGRYAEKGLNFTIKTLTPSEMYEIQREAIDEEGRMDNELYNISLLEHTMVDYNPKSQELRESLDCYSSQEVINKLFHPSELIQLLRQIDSFAMKGNLPKVDLKK